MPWAISLAPANLTKAMPQGITVRSIKELANRLSRRNSRRGVRQNLRRLLAEQLEDRRVLAAVTWDGGAGSLEWSAAANWDTDTVPTVVDDVFIPDLEGEPTINVKGTFAVNSLNTLEQVQFSGGSFAVAASVNANAVDLVLSGAALIGGNWEGSGTFRVTSSDGTLDGVTLGVGTTLLTGAQVTVLNGLTLDNSTLRLERSGSTTSFSDDVGLNFSGTQTLGGSGTVELHSALNSSNERYIRVRPTDGGTLTIGPDVMVQNSTTSFFTTVGDPSLPLIIEGTIKGQTTRTTNQTFRVTGSTVTNNGVIDAVTSDVQFTTLPTNLVAGVLTAGVWISIAGEIKFPAGTEVTSLAATVELLGINSKLSTPSNTDVLLTLVSVAEAGELRLGDQRSLELGALENSGLVQVDETASLIIAGFRYSQIAGATIIDGTLASPADDIAISGGVVRGNGQISGDIVFASDAELRSGPVADGPGVIATQDLQIDSPAQFFVDISGPIPGGAVAGAEYDQVVASGQVSLSGTLAVRTFDSIVLGTQFTIIENDGTDPVSGTFAGLPEGAVIDNGYDEYSISYVGGDGNDVVLTALTNVRIVRNSTDAGVGSLRGELDQANLLPDPVAILFDLPGSAPYALSPNSPLPAISNTIYLDATTQAGYSDSPLIELVGHSAGSSNGLQFVLGSAGSVLTGLSITGFSGDGVNVQTAGVHIRKSLFVENGELGIDYLADGPTAGNYPIIQYTQAGPQTRLIGFLTAAPNTVVEVDVFANTVPDPSGFGEGERYLGTFVVTTDANGDATFSETLAAATSLDEFLSATATSALAGTSEFSNAAVMLPPVAIDDSLESDEDSEFTFSVIANDEDPQGSIVASQTIALNSPSAGTLANLANGSFTFTPPVEFNSLALGESTSIGFDYQIEDVFGVTDSASVNILINGVNDAPVASNVSDTASEDGPAVTVSASFVDVDTSDTHTFGINTTGTLGSVVNNGDGSFTYDPDGAFEALAAGETATDTFTYTITDNNGASSTATVQITINGANDAPIAVNDIASAGENTVSDIDVLANDTDVDNLDDPSNFSLDTIDSVAVSGLTIDPTLPGSVISIVGNQVRFAPDTFFDELDAGDQATVTIAYTMSDAQGASSFAELVLAVNGSNDAPVATNDLATTDEAASVTIDVLANDTDVDLDDEPATFNLDSASITSTTGLSNSPVAAGTVTVLAGEWVFDPGRDCFFRQSAICSGGCLLQRL